MRAFAAILLAGVKWHYATIDISLESIIVADLWALPKLLAELSLYYVY